jgi:hypothetical protein
MELPCEIHWPLTEIPGKDGCLQADRFQDARNVAVFGARIAIAGIVCAVARSVILRFKRRLRWTSVKPTEQTGQATTRTERV